MRLHPQYIFAFYALLLVQFSQAQDRNNIRIPLSNPEKGARLEIHNHNGTIDVIGHEGNDMIVEYVEASVSGKIFKSPAKANGLKRIPNNVFDIQISERHNEVNISPSSTNKRINFIIKVPYHCNLELSTHHNGNIYVENVSGEINLNAHHGSIKFADVAGSVVADTHHGYIKGSFVNTDEGPIAFSTYHGDIDVIFPENMRAGAKIKSSKGQIYTDFDLESSRVSKQQNEHGSSGLKIKIGEWVHANINGGGQQIMFSTYHGDVMIRKGE